MSARRRRRGSSCCTPPTTSPTSAPARGTDLVVMTSNLEDRRRRPGRGRRRGALAPRRRAHARGTDAGDRAARCEHAGLDALLPHSVSDPQDGGAGTGLWSRYPLTSTRKRRRPRLRLRQRHERRPAAMRSRSRPCTSTARPRSAVPTVGRPTCTRYPHVLGALPGPTVAHRRRLQRDDRTTAQFRDDPRSAASRRCGPGRRRVHPDLAGRPLVSRR